MKLHIESKEQIIEAKADSRGRITLGSAYADENVQVAILEADDAEEANE